MTPCELLICAEDAMVNSYSLYSCFSVGAALITADGRVYKGCNIENSAFSPTICAERTAFFKAISEGENDFEAIAIVGKYKNGEYKHLCYPCGVCRQVMEEFCGDDFKIILGDGKGEYEVHTLSELLPGGFDLRKE